MKNDHSHSEEDTFNTLVKLKILRVIFFMKVLRGPADIVVETQAKNCSKPEKDWKLPSASMTSNVMFRSIILYIFMK